jgi:nitroreductase
MSVHELIKKNRSYRRFYQDWGIEQGTLRELVGLARLSASAANLQPLKFILSTEPEKNGIIFEHLAWAAYLKEWPGPSEGERPSAYIVVLGDTRIAQSVNCDHGIACQSILMGAVEKGLGGCIIGSIKREKLSSSLGISSYLKILLVVALGRPKETVVTETVGPEGDIRYWRDEEGVHHVPKRRLEDLIVE